LELETDDSKVMDNVENEQLLRLSLIINSPEKDMENLSK